VSVSAKAITVFVRQIEKIRGYVTFMTELHPSETLEVPWDTISINLIVELLESHSYNAIMCIVNSLTNSFQHIPPSMQKALLSSSLQRSGNTTGHLR
jgi:hypothetical protein